MFQRYFLFKISSSEVALTCNWRNGLVGRQGVSVLLAVINVHDIMNIVILYYLLYCTYYISLHDAIDDLSTKSGTHTPTFTILYTNCDSLPMLLQRLMLCWAQHYGKQENLTAFANFMVSVSAIGTFSFFSSTASSGWALSNTNPGIPVNTPQIWP